MGYGVDVGYGVAVGGTGVNVGYGVYVGSGAALPLQPNNKTISDVARNSRMDFILI